MGRSPCCSKDGLNKGAWSPNEDKILIEYIKVHGEGRWRNIPQIAAGRLPGRTDNEIKNYWNNHLGKKVKDGHQIITNAKSIENPKPNGIPKIKVKVTASPSQLKLDTDMVLTKTNMCSSVLIKNPISNSSKAENSICNNDSVSDQIEPNENSGFLSFINKEEKELTTDLLKDFMVREDICSSDILNSDFSNMCDFSYSDNMCDSLSDEILMDWTQSSLADETNVSNRE
ncbi:unnamed protein product [Lupinus luteus]|uniref:Uncharacterized protein n=1 Tax=Lupinus luteus TaxID=3873 RepID=A0AAV1WCQ9_LUPLU